MKLKSLQIKNYRSIEDTSFDILEIADQSFTYGLIGINEAGKSSILKALALKDGLSDRKGPLPRSSDFRGNQPIEIFYCYDVDEDTKKELSSIITNQFQDLELEESSLSELILKISFLINNPNEKIVTLEFPNINISEKESIQDSLKQVVFDKSHKSLFWTADDKYLITEPILLTNFANDPGISIPLWNSFSLLGLKTQEDIRARINLITDSTERAKLREDLGEVVTKHVNQAWPEHKIEIKFDISDGNIFFHIYDIEAKGKAKTIDQRSDGFGQFISFLLSVAAENANDQLENSLVLIDEPETHLHPKAQEDMLNELIKITKNERNNIAFFATHSNYLIDKNHLDRNFRISKSRDISEKGQLRSGSSTYASVTYEVFGIPNSDYHNELYGFLEENSKSKLDSLTKDKIWKNEKTNKDENVSLPTYIRHSIHHPENNSNKMYSSDELIKSLETLKGLLDEK